MKADVLARWCRLSALVVMAAGTAACSAAPSRSIMGAYFPSWMLCALMGVAGTMIVRAILSSTGLLEEMPAPVVVLLALAVAITLGIWMVWLS